jgi:hypothetical protein
MIVFCIIGFAMDFLPKVYIGCASGSLIFSLLASMLDRLREMAGQKAD